MTVVPDPKLSVDESLVCLAALIIYSRTQRVSDSVVEMAYGKLLAAAARADKAHPGALDEAEARHRLMNQLKDDND